MSTGPVMSITDDQIAEIEALAESACQYEQTDWFAPSDLSEWFADDDAKFIGFAGPFTVRALITRLREAERDAKRYKFLRESGKFSPSAFGGWALNCGYTRTPPSLLDAAIDAAMQEDKQ